MGGGLVVVVVVLVEEEVVVGVGEGGKIRRSGSQSGWWCGMAIGG